ncbi:hypothetical protein PUN28_008352 [Cardiocondyla obscurior]|uniref:Large ribosomal subunit protein bL9m n=1 Tax=Cardiocondyla obscurior TaxID=286306 RepID=A0AAW2FYZ0_9HYME
MLKFPNLLVTVNHVKALTTPVSPSRADYLFQQIRTTFILKRRYPVPLHKKNGGPKPLKHKHYIYDLIEDTNVKKKEPLDLILTQYVAELGNVGTRISMHPFKAYTQLLLPKLADYATPENIEKYTKLAVDEKDDMPFSSASVEKTMKELSHMRISILMSKDIPWTLEKWHVKANFRKSGIYISEDAITIPERPISGPNLDLEGKEFYVTLTINNREQVKVRCCLHHWMALHTQDFENANQPSEPIFLEDKPILDSLPPFQVKKKNKKNT